MKGKRPDYSVNTVIPTDNGDWWREIGVAFASERGGTITVLLDALLPQDPLREGLVHSAVRPRRRRRGSPIGSRITP